MRRRLILVLLACCGGPLAAAPPSPASPDDPLQSDECRQALAALQAEEAKAMRAVRSASQPHTGRSQDELPAAWVVAGRHAARVCLKDRGDPPLPTHSLAPPPFTVAPAIAPRIVAPVPAPRPPVGVAPPVRSEPPAALTNCDGGGCWTSNGTWLQRVGPTLLGPSGFCSVQGTMVRCP